MIIKYNFERFTGAPARGDTRISINRSGLIRLSAGFCRVNNILSFKYCILFYDRSNGAIALKFINNKEDGVLKVTKDRKAATLAATSFIKSNKLDLRSNFKRHDWKKLSIPDVGEVFVVELSKR
ncbi:hypothetical protein A2313_04360 [Candidatus Roizmanbacteria bacterium RIFOXYB2_FULL_41_10]|uniref:Uncharacterized protein n=1 Tax=Candidatus Roizmanbacteria bacterium RIFOXYA1_FULL_41_12 TaxID=1802082 RepID=A0A1F7KF89_9BACT|nr:MAG: hypothetical protein A2262_00345 [Candidatus Roizmanbacteria bacterium RIFOXYA2_FULL_41_8]OGK66515.1 MAG: hypothetical protein A2209_00740 [Candidatus Roizmanbacteria bacterium RIFOXYA1_FULL_41_12]OGK67068.1 MAG: hypothetical protein A2377_03680 [Candidatus Roizmanbacteria bacterium RIFOXYB1_FULL_41_27]OGK69391.1 MAG: hypothetical protein A2403_04190 [Candidatus Roizmanbacteria bacterium RIFOXYC1_FULL_41_16]OGK72164.1 MAG: hypothetical protein A2313_04360 [Candidatus Roizmanbacteria bac